MLCIFLLVLQMKYESICYPLMLKISSWRQHTQHSRAIYKLKNCSSISSYVWKIVRFKPPKSLNRMHAKGISLILFQQGIQFIQKQTQALSLYKTCHVKLAFYLEPQLRMCSSKILFDQSSCANFPKLHRRVFSTREDIPKNLQP